GHVLSGCFLKVVAKKYIIPQGCLLLFVPVIKRTEVKVCTNMSGRQVEGFIVKAEFVAASSNFIWSIHSKINLEVAEVCISLTWKSRKLLFFSLN
ncbi:unnamed protein product, partial [Urochloa humidicola]